MGEEGKHGGSFGVWLPSLPSPEEVLENIDNKNSCDQAKRKCHFYPGLVLGTVEPPAPGIRREREREDRGDSSGLQAGIGSTAGSPRPKGKR